MDNFQLGWRMTFEFEDGRSEKITLKYPLTVEFDIHRSGKVDNQNARFKLYNLNRSTRQLLFKDILSNNVRGEQVRVLFEAGYNGKYSLAYHGTLLECNSYRDGGSTEVITEMSCFDINPLKYIGKTYSVGTPVKDIIADVANMLQLELGSIGEFEKTVKENYTISGKALYELDKLTGGCAYVDNNKLHVLSPTECVKSERRKFHSGNIYGTPKRSEGFITFTSRLSTDITLMQLVDVESTIQPESNGVVKVFDIRHKGMISASVPCEANTTLTCWYGSSKRDVPVNVTFGIPSGEEVTSVEDIKTNNAKVTSIHKDFVEIEDSKLIPITSGNRKGLYEVYKDIYTNGIGAKSLVSRVLGNIYWQDIIQHPNLSSSERPTYRHILNVYNTLTTLLGFIRKNIGNKAIICTSGWRSIQNNRNVGGKAESKHLQGLAIDFKFSTPALTREFGKGVFETKWAKQTQGWAGYYPDKNIIHVQLNSKKPDPK